MKKRQYLRKMATQQFYKSMQMLQANAKREKDEPFEDYSIFLYRQTAPDFKDRVKDLEQKILYPVSWKLMSANVWLCRFLYLLMVDKKPVFFYVWNNSVLFLKILNKKEVTWILPYFNQDTYNLCFSIIIHYNQCEEI